MTTFEDSSRRALEVGLQQATEANERLWLHNRRMHDALKMVEDWLNKSTIVGKIEWEDRVRASLEDNEP